MNNAEHIRCVVPQLSDERKIRRSELVTIINQLVEPFIGGWEPQHFEQVNETVHRILRRAKRGKR